MTRNLDYQGSAVGPVAIGSYIYSVGSFDFWEEGVEGVCRAHNRPERSLGSTSKQLKQKKATSTSKQLKQKIGLPAYFKTSKSFLQVSLAPIFSYFKCGARLDKKTYFLVKLYQRLDKNAFLTCFLSKFLI